IDSGKLIGEGGTKDDLYIVDNFTPTTSQAFNFSSRLDVVPNKLWHARLGHPHSRALKLMVPNVSFDHSTCEACILGKHCKTVFPISSTLYENCFDLVHSDVWTPP
ncbi:GAG-pre-integrase domain-containing protein, partial [Escherichia coli]